MFKYALANQDGEIFSEYESMVSNWKVGDELRAAGNVEYRVTAVVPLSLSRSSSSSRCMRCSRSSGFRASADRGTA
jgi:hypothetical protein